MIQPNLTLALAPGPDAASLAGTLVADACRAWRLPELLHPARRVMSELVLNAVEHAGTELVVTISRHGDGLHLAVADGDPRLPRLRAPARVRRDAPLDERGRGLRVVQAAATGWGVERTPTGKVVWAAVRPTDPGRTSRRVCRGGASARGDLRLEPHEG